MQFKEQLQYDISCIHNDTTKSIKDALNMLRTVTNGNLVEEAAKVVNGIRDTLLENIPTSVGFYPYNESEVLEGYTVPLLIDQAIQQTLSFDHATDTFIESVGFHLENITFSPDDGAVEKNSLVLIAPTLARYTAGMGELVADLAFQPIICPADPMEVIAPLMNEYENVRSLQNAIRGLLQAAPAGTQYQVTRQRCNCCDAEYMHITGRYHALAFELAIHLGAQVRKPVH